MRRSVVTHALRHRDPPDAAVTRRWPRATSDGRCETPVLQREALGPGSSLNGPAIVKQLDTTTVLPPGVHTETDDSGNLINDVPAT